MMTCDCSWLGCFILWGIPIALYAWMYHYNREAFWGAIQPPLYLAAFIAVGLILKPFIT